MTFVLVVNREVFSLKIKALHIRNLTVFNNSTLNFSKGINVFIGKNGTGKTQILKALYAVCETNKNHDNRELAKCFKLNNRRYLHRNPNENVLLALDTYPNNTNGELVSYSYPDDLTSKNSTGEHLPYMITCPDDIINSTYIPAKDMLTHSNGLLSMEKKYSEFPFEKTNLDIISRAMQWTVKNPPDYALNIIADLERKIGGKIIVDNDEFFLQKTSGEKISFFNEAEGIKKLGLFWRLLMNENIDKNSILLWDEPEANINPEYIVDLVKHLIALSRTGIQIFVSTHNYMVAKCFSVYGKSDDDILFHSFYKENDSSLVSVARSHDFESIASNSILAAMDKLVEDVYGFSMEE